jgi:hypothetical protein
MRGTDELLAGGGVSQRLLFQGHGAGGFSALQIKGNGEAHTGKRMQ